MAQLATFKCAFCGKDKTIKASLYKQCNRKHCSNECRQKNVRLPYDKLFEINSLTYSKQKGVIIQLTKGYVSIIDKDDVDRISKHSWHIDTNGYAVRGQTDKITKRFINIFLHQEILNFPDSQIDHINRDKLDNRKSNLRLCTLSENKINQKIYKSNSVGYKGVSKKNNNYQARLTVNGKRINLGRYPTAQQAGMAYKNALNQYYPNINQLI